MEDKKTKLVDISKMMSFRLLCIPRKSFVTNKADDFRYIWMKITHNIEEFGINTNLICNTNLEVPHGVCVQLEYFENETHNLSS